MATSPKRTSWPRWQATRLREALRDTPCVLIHGPRQSGKTTLAREVGEAKGYRDRDDYEVDIVLEQGARTLVGVEVKAAASVNDADLRGLRRLRDAAGERFRAGVVIYDGSATVPMEDRLFAVPVRRLWEG